MSASPPHTKRVVHVTFGLHVGGQEKLLVELARHSERSRSELTFVSLGDRGELAQELEAQNAKVVALGEPVGLKPSLIPRLFRLFRRLGATVVHTHDPRSLLYAAPAARLARIPVLVHTCHRGDLVPTSRQEVLFRFACRLLDRCVCVSNEVEAQSRAMGIPQERLCTIRNGIDLTTFRFQGPVLRGPVVTVARLRPEKDLANLVQAASAALGQASDLRFEIAGTGRCLDELIYQAEELNIAGKIAFLGEVQDVPSLLSRASMLVLPSRSEGMPLTILEAMACGLPVISTRVGGVPEVVDDDETGFLVPSADPSALAHAILTIWRDPARGQAMGRCGRRRVEQLFDVRRMVDEYEELYQQIWMSGRRGVAKESTGVPVA